MANLWEIDFDWNKSEEEKPSKAKEEKKKRERAAAMELSQKYLYRRAFSEVTLMDVLRDIDFKPGTCVNVISGGDIDQMSYLSFFARKYDLTDVAVTTWCMSAEDAFQLTEWMRGGRIKGCDIYVGEIFKSSYAPIWGSLKDFYKGHPEQGRLAMFKCHAKIIVGKTPDFAFSVQTSANMDTNPRTEQACIQIGDETYDFFKTYLDGIISYEK